MMTAQISLAREPSNGDDASYHFQFDRVYRAGESLSYPPNDVGSLQKDKHGRSARQRLEWGGIALPCCQQQPAH